jgi:hypothetical protein
MKCLDSHLTQTQREQNRQFSELRDQIGLLGAQFKRCFDKQKHVDDLKRLVQVAILPYN